MGFLCSADRGVSDGFKMESKCRFENAEVICGAIRRIIKFAIYFLAMHLMQMYGMGHEL